MAARMEATCASVPNVRSRAARSIVAPDGETPTTLSSATIIRRTHSRMMSARITAYTSKCLCPEYAAGDGFRAGSMVAKLGFSAVSATDAT